MIFQALSSQYARLVGEHDMSSRKVVNGLVEQFHSIFSGLFLMEYILYFSKNGWVKFCLLCSS